MLKLIFFLIIVLFYNLSFSQTDTLATDTTKSVYKNLTTRKFYNMGYSSSGAWDNKPAVYKINDKEVNEETYDKYHSTWKNMETCNPCILLTYDYNEKLLSKGIQYTDCRVGFWIEYFPNGKVKLIGHYKENKTGNWDSIFDRGFCQEDGVWTYFNEAGNKLYSEYWKEGEFIKQVPEQKKTELLGVGVTHNGLQVDNQTLNPKQVSEIKITTSFKNKQRIGTNLTFKFKIRFKITASTKITTSKEGTSMTGIETINKTFSFTDFNKIDIQKMLLESGVMPTETTHCSIMIFNNGVHLFNVWLKVKE